MRPAQARECVINARENAHVVSGASMRPGRSGPGMRASSSPWGSSNWECFNEARAARECFLTRDQLIARFGKLQ
jgi:hypothetical protein